MAQIIREERNCSHSKRCKKMTLGEIREKSKEANVY